MLVALFSLASGSASFTVVGMSADGVSGEMISAAMCRERGSSVVGDARGESGRGVEVGESGFGGPLTIGTSSFGGGVGDAASGWSVIGTGEGVALVDGAGVELPDASPIANLARSLSSSVDRADRGVGAGVGAGSTGVGEVAAGCPTVAGPALCDTNDLRRLLSADSASWDEDERDVRMPPSDEERVCASSADAS